MAWDLNQLEALLSDNQDLVVTKEQNCLMIANSDGIDAWLAISGEQIIVETLLFAKSEVKDSAALNEEILKTHMLFPLTTVGISQVGGDEYYTAFGSLSSQSKAESIVIELNTLFQNVEAFIDAYQIHLK
ncbi:MAG: YjfI family protein [Paraglaciecola sp.]|uniref:YjfI family protein n=1 Tax=Pseudomonadati TaxID=3379134 RepID=UPI00273E5EEA|nr:YjfI family protein [Paraglaciecola sp.]MDP5029519.1 YjfI family protein [Paraglaciecola sp.]MDP5041679.1 YjfI family protein [Paraglaciecola sp.]MDP5129268.1 YjfI family protein [Paraglaciecola sp.]